MSIQAQILRVAAGQVFVDADVAANAQRIQAMMDCAAAEAVDLLVLPETALTGYSPSIGHGRPAEDWAIIKAQLDQIALHAAKLSLTTIVGSESLTETGWVNRLYAYSAQGQELAAYDKVHLMDNDVPYYRPGRSPTLVTVKGVKIGLQICYDVRFPEGYRTLLHQGAQVIAQGFYGAGGNTWKLPIMDAHLVSRAAESGCFIIAANVANPLPILTSQIVDPIGVVLARADLETPDLAIANLDLQRIEQSEIRRNYLDRHWHGQHAH